MDSTILDTISSAAMSSVLNPLSRFTVILSDGGEQTDVSKLSADYLRYGQEWAALLDRSFLGSLAAPVDVLSAAFATEAITVAMDSPYGSSWDNKSAAKWLIESKLDELVVKHGFPYPVANADDGFAALRAEVYFWWAGGFSVNGYSDLLKRDIHSPARDFLDTVALHPEEHPFYEAGLFDRALIARCLAEGIDIDMAVSMVAG